MENNENLLRLTQVARKQSEIDERTPRAMWHLLKSLASNKLREASKVIEAGYDINSVIQVQDPKTPEVFREFGKKEGWDIHDDITVLGISAFMNDETAVMWLIEHGVNIDTPFDNGRDAFWLAMSKSSTKVMNLLYDHGADLYWSLPKEENVNRLIFATNLSKVDNVQWLKSKGHDLHTMDALGRTALHHNLMQSPYTESDQRIGEILLAENLSPDQEDDLGMPAHAYGNEETLKFLNEKGFKKFSEVSFQAEHNFQKWAEKKNQERVLQAAKKTVGNQRIQIAKPIYKPKIMGH